MPAGPTEVQQAGLRSGIQIDLERVIVLPLDVRRPGTRTIAALRTLCTARRQLRPWPDPRRCRLFPWLLRERWRYRPLAGVTMRYSQSSVTRDTQ
jgi:hypothetical protein